MYNTLAELKTQEFENVEKTYNDISSKLRDIGEIRFYKVFGVAYLAYLAKVNKLETAKELSDYVAEQLPIEQGLFLKESVNNSWSMVIEISGAYSVATLLAAVLWMQPSNGKAEGESGTPDSIINLATKILDVQQEKVADFCCGVGNFLVNAVGQDSSSNYYGIELNTQSKEIAEIRLHLLSDEIKIDLGTVFDIVADQKFDKIFCDYPWSVPKNSTWISEETMSKFDAIIPEMQRLQKSDWLFIMNVMQHLNEDGKAVVVTTNGITWNGGIDRIIREKFVKMGYIEAVISLPANMYSTTAIPTSMIVFSKSNKTIRMIDAGSLASVGRRQNYLSHETIEEIAFMMTKDSDKSKSVTFEDIEKEDYAINPARFLQVEADVENGVPFENVILNITRGAQVKANILDDLVSEEPTDCQYLMLSNIKDGIIDENLPYIKSIERKLEKYCIKNNSLVISKNGTPIKIAVASVPDDRKILGNGNLYVIELDQTKVNPYFIKAYLESENGTIALSRVMVGATIPNIPIDGLKKIMVPCPDMETQNKVAENYLAKMDEVKVLRYKLAKATAELRDIYEEGC